MSVLLCIFSVIPEHAIVLDFIAELIIILAFQLFLSVSKTKAPADLCTKILTEFLIKGDPWFFIFFQ